MPRLPIVSSLCLVLSALAPLPAGAQDSTAICKDESSAPDAAIAACGKIISASKAKTNDLASTYYNRAIAYRQKNDLDNALSDYNDAIKINPKHARAFNNRWELDHIGKPTGLHQRKRFRCDSQYFRHFCATSLSIIG